MATHVILIHFVFCRYNMLPVVMGARPREYGKVSPRHSYIHTDDFSGPQELAKYLHYLSNNDTEYKEYFQWRKTLEITKYVRNAEFWCRLCTLLNFQVTVRGLYCRSDNMSVFVNRSVPLHDYYSELSPHSYTMPHE